ncbi:MAG: response regulator, partial [Pseudomonadota bacterium]|nr:response regulator [Pseudomonadota bacterium]
MEKRFHILVVDDDKRIRDLLARYLSENGFWVTSTASSAEARKQLNNFIYDLIVLDVMMPGESGISLAQSLKKVSSVPILLLTAMAESADRIAGFEIGIDDYLTKPFEPKELVFRIKNILKRNVSSKNKARREIKFGQYCFDINKETLNIDGKNVYLTTS